MGSFRRRLTALFALLPGAVWAEVCDKEFPDWDGTPATVWSEALILFSSGPALVLLIATAFVIRSRSQLGGLAVVVGWSILTAIITMADPMGIQAAAIAEGCRARPTIFLLGVTLICAGLVLYTMQRADMADKSQPPL